MKRSRILWGLGFVAVSLLLILNAVGVTLGLPDGIPIWKIVLSVIFVVCVVNSLIKLKIPEIFFPLTFIVMLFEKEIAGLLGIQDGDIASVWGFLLVALLLTIGSALLLPRRLFRKRAKVNIKVNNTRHGNNIYYVDCANPVNEHIENNLGACDVFFANPELYDGNGVVSIENNLGSVTVHVPIEWNVISKMENNLGSVEIPKSETVEGAKSIRLVGDNNLGKVSVVFGFQ